MITLSSSLLLDHGAWYYLYEDTQQNYTSTTHKHPFHQLYVVLEGEIKHRQNRTLYSAKSNDLIFTPEEAWHSLEFSENIARYFCFSFSHRFYLEIMHHFQNLVPEHLGAICLFNLDYTTTNKLETIFKLLINEQNSYFETAQNYGGLLATTALVEIFRSVNIIPDYAPRPVKGTEIEHCISYISVHYNEKLLVDKLCKQCYLSKSNLYRQFYRVTGKTVHQFITEQRILAAAKLLGESSLEISKISTLVGYQDFSTFYRNFIRVIGSTPSEYRENCLSIYKSQQSATSAKLDY